MRIDRAGNVLGDRPGAAPRPRLVVAAHLDTVFPEGHERQGQARGPHAARTRHRRQLPRAGGAGRGRPIAQGRRRPDARQHHVRGECRRGGSRRSAGHESALQRDDEGADRSVRFDRRSGHARHARRGRQPPVSHDVQGAGRSQLRRLWPAQSRQRAGTGRGEDRRDSGAESAAHHIQCRPHRWRHLGQRDSGGGVDGGGHAIVRSRRRWRLSTPGFRRPWTPASPKKTGAGSRRGRSR